MKTAHEKCEKMPYTMEVKVCRCCGKSSDEDSQTRMYCTDCAKRLGVCRCCGKKIK